MKRVALYNPAWRTMGGGEKYIATIADVLSHSLQFDVTLLADDTVVIPDRFRAAFNIPLAQVHCRYLRPRDIMAVLSAADIAIVVSNFRPLGIRAKKNVFILQIPYGPITAGTVLRRALQGRLREIGKDLLRLRLLRNARTADLVLVYSRFVQETLERCHGVRSEVLYPAIDNFGGKMEKKKFILSVGRIFHGRYNDKRYDALIRGFKILCDAGNSQGWEYRIVGNAWNDRQSRSYLTMLRSMAEGYPIRFFVNSPYAELAGHYREASIFWHGAGFGVDENQEPERTEHFGMTTVEAMSAGCVPVVLGKGGQKEIVRDGISGFLWNSLDELAERTLSLMGDPSMMARMQQEARARYCDFDRPHFQERLMALIGRL